MVVPRVVAAEARMALAAAIALEVWFPKIVLVGMAVIMVIATNAMPTAAVMTRTTMIVTMVSVSMAMPT